MSKRNERIIKPLPGNPSFDDIIGGALLGKPITRKEISQQIQAEKAKKKLTKTKPSKPKKKTN